MFHYLTIRRIVSDIRCKHCLKYPLSTIRPKLTIVRALFLTTSQDLTKGADQATYLKVSSVIFERKIRAFFEFLE